jgi:hypothetical protein
LNRLRRPDLGRRKANAAAGSNSLLHLSTPQASAETRTAARKRPTRHAGSTRLRGAQIGASVRGATETLPAGKDTFDAHSVQRRRDSWPPEQVRKVVISVRLFNHREAAVHRERVSQYPPFFSRPPFSAEPRPSSQAVLRARRSARSRRVAKLAPTVIDRSMLESMK